MKVEHITLGGNSQIRDTAGIAPETIGYFRRVKAVYSSASINLPEANASVKITATDEGAAFDMLYNGAPVVTNLCCFSAGQKPGIMELVSGLAGSYPLYKGMNPKAPAMDVFLYSIVLLPFAPPEWVSIAGEIELYIFDQLYSAWIEKQN